MIEVGQKLWLVRTGMRDGHVIVAKVGRKWADISREGSPIVYGRIDIKTLRLDGGEFTSPGRCFLSKKAHDMHEAIWTAWNELTRSLTSVPPPSGMTLAKIEKLKRIIYATNGEGSA